MSEFNADVKHIHLIPLLSEVYYIRNVAESLGANVGAHILREDTLSRYQDRNSSDWVAIYIAQDNYVLNMEKISDERSADLQIHHSEKAICH